MASILSSRPSEIQANQAWRINQETARNSSPSADGSLHASKDPWVNYPPFLRWPWVLILTLGFSLFLLALTGCGGSPGTVTVTINAPSATSIDPGQSVNLTVTLTNDSSNKGVQWTITCTAGACGVLSNNTTTSVTYTAPSTVAAQFTVTITATSIANTKDSQTLNLTVVANPAITTTAGPLAPGTVGTAYSVTLTETGGVAPYSWSISTGTLPPGLTLNSSTGVISGTPTAAGTSNFTVTLTDSGSPALTFSANFSIAVSPAPAITFTTTALSAGVVGAAYTSSVAATGGAGALTYAVTSGGLPAGLSLSGGGAISGTPTSAGKSSFTVTASDAYGDTAKANLSITISAAPAITFTTTTLPEGVVGSAYSATVAATGGAGTLTYKLTAGSLPAGVALSTAGALTGTPTAGGTSNFKVTASDAYGDSGNANLSITIAAALSVTTASLPNGTLQAMYTATLAAGGGVAPYTWSVSTGSLPAGLSLAASTGIISGTPTATGASSFTIKVTDSESTPASATANLSITVNAAQLAITTSSLPAGALTVNYSQTLAASGGTAPYTWSISNGSLPAGLSLAAGTGVISGTPTATGASSFTVQVKDSEATPQTKTANLTITINPAALSITATTLPVGTEGTSYTTTLLVTGGTAPYTWSVSNGSLPVGLSLAASTGIISGTPTAAGTSSFTVQVKDSEATPQTKTANLTITINPPALAITSAVLPTATEDTLYTTTLSASGGIAPYTWSVSTGSLPAGLSLAAGTGIISGTPTATGSSNFTIKVTDSESTPASATANLSITVNAAALAITTLSLPAGVLTVNYSQTLAASGGTAPYTWSISNGSLPAGLSLAASSGIISGTPTATGTASFTVQVKDSEATPQTETANLSITINPAPLSITSTVLPVGTVGAAYTTRLAATGGTAPYSWSVSSGALPAGLTLDASTGVISGTPTQFQADTFSVQVQDSEATP
ncbi:MAG: putative Ig domain-containing protein, partial [Terracidiphilus sp.]